MRILFLLLVLLGLGWFGYGFLAGGSRADARTRAGMPQEVILVGPFGHGEPTQPSAGAPPAAAPPAPAPFAGEVRSRLEAGRLKEAFQEVSRLATDNAGDPRFRELAKEAFGKALAAEELEWAARLATAVLDRWSALCLRWPEEAAEWQEWDKLLRESASRLVFDPAGCWRSRTWEVKPGECLDRIRDRLRVEDRLKVESGFLAAVNRITPDRLRPGRSLRIPRGALKVVVERRSFVLKLFLDEILIRVYRVGLGKDGKTPVHAFEVGLKQEKPVWYPPDEFKSLIPKGLTYIPHGHPANPLGDHFIKFKESGSFRGFGIHGTRVADRPSIGTNASEGCVRMLGEDVAELFAFLPVGAVVEIR